MPVIAQSTVWRRRGANIALAVIRHCRALRQFRPSLLEARSAARFGRTWTLPRLIGMRGAGLTLLGNKLPAEQAAAWDDLAMRCMLSSDDLDALAEGLP